MQKQSSVDFSLYIKSDKITHCIIFINSA